MRFALHGPEGGYDQEPCSAREIRSGSPPDNVSREQEVDHAKGKCHRHGARLHRAARRHGHVLFKV
jgi:hypothetical protein